MALHWLPDPLPALREFARVLAPEGLLMFSTLGPDTLKELRAAAGAARVHAFTDMHDLGDMLVAAGFSRAGDGHGDDRDRIPRPAILLADLRASGQTSARADRPRGLAGAALRRALRASSRRAPPSRWSTATPGRRKQAADVEPDAKTVRIFKRMP